MSQPVEAPSSSALRRALGRPLIAVVASAFLILVPSWLIHAPADWAAPAWLRGSTSLLGFALVCAGAIIAIGLMRHLVLRVFFVVVLVCLALRENFPFSHYPMYSSFSDYSFVVFLADGNGDPLPVETLTSVRTSALKKNFRSNLKETEVRKRADGTWEGYRYLSMEDRNPAGEKTLRWLVESCKPGARELLLGHRPLRLYMVELRYRDGKIVRSEPASVAELP